LPAGSAIAQLAKVGVKVTRKAVEDAASAFKLTDEIIPVSECTDGRGRRRIVSMGEMYLVFNHYVQLGYSLSFALDVAKKYFKDERDRESFKKGLISAWRYRFMSRYGFRSTEQRVSDFWRGLPCENS